MQVSFAPVYLAYRNAYIAHLVDEGDSKTATSFTVDKFDQLIKRMDKWESDFRYVFPKTTEDYQMTFPNGRQPFNSGARELRIIALDALLSKIMPLPDMDDLKAEIQVFSSEITARFSSQQQQQERLRLASNDLEDERILLCEELYGNLGTLMAKYKKTPVDVGRFFDFAMLKRAISNEHEIYTGAVDSAATVNIIEQVFTNGSEALIRNTGVTDLAFALVPTSETSCINIGVNLLRDEKRTIMLSDLGNLNNTFLNVTNLYAVGQGNYSVTIL
ncbi:MAG: hypothetical protein WCJ01_11905 [Ignavibacteria bacterium]